MWGRDTHHHQGQRTEMERRHRERPRQRDMGKGRQRARKSGNRDPEAMRDPGGRPATQGPGGRGEGQE